MKKFLGMVLGLSTAAVFAENATGLYVGVGAGAGWNDMSSPSAAFRLDGGYQINPGFAIEVGTTGLTQSGGAINENIQLYDLSVKGTLPMGNMFDLFLQLGGAYQTPGALASTPTPSTAGGYGGYANGTYRQAGWQVLTGGGLEINLTKMIAFNVTDLYYYGSNNALGNTNVLLGGLKFSF
jgi:hypothetical protein